MAEIKMDKVSKECKGLIKWAVVHERQVPLWELFNRILRGTRRSKVKVSSSNIAASNISFARYFSLASVSLGSKSDS
jgi:hypothetical protein